MIGRWLSRRRERRWREQDLAQARRRWAPFADIPLADRSDHSLIMESMDNPDVEAAGRAFAEQMRRMGP